MNVHIQTQLLSSRVPQEISQWGINHLAPNAQQDIIVQAQALHQLNAQQEHIIHH